MEMFLAALCLSLLGAAASAVAFAAASAGAPQAPEPSVERKEWPVGVPDRFFIEAVTRRGDERVPIEALLLQIERHIQLEQAAAESFLDSPTSQSLHSGTMSPLVH